MAAVSRAPYAKLAAYKKRMGWGFPWWSSLGSDFNFDYRVSFPDEAERGNTTADCGTGDSRADITSPIRDAWPI